MGKQSEEEEKRSASGSHDPNICAVEEKGEKSSKHIISIIKLATYIVTKSQYVRHKY